MLLINKCLFDVLHKRNQIDTPLVHEVIAIRQTRVYCHLVHIVVTLYIFHRFNIVSPWLLIIRNYPPLFFNATVTT